MRRILIGLLVLSGLAFAARGGEQLSTETLLPLHQGKDAYTPAAAFGPAGAGKGVCLVAWQSGRMGEESLVEHLVYDADLVACRVGADGKPLDTKPFIVSQAKDLQERPSIAFGPATSSTGSGQGSGVFLVVWQDLRNGKDYDVYAARVTPEGKVLDAEGIAVSSLAHNQCLPRVAWDGKNFQIVWQDFRSGVSYEIYGARVSPGGKVLDPQGECLMKRYHSLAGGDRYAPAIASSGDGKSLVLWCSHWRGKVSGGVMVADGKVVNDKAYVYAGDGRRHGPGGESHPVSLAAGPKGYLSAWMTFVPAGRGVGARDSTAMVLDKTGKHKKYLFLAGKQHYTRQTHVTWDGAAYSAAWIERVVVKRGQAPHDGVFLARISQSGEAIGPVRSMGGTFETPTSKPVVASDGKGTTFIAYERHPKTADVPIKIAFRVLRAK